MQSRAPRRVFVVPSVRRIALALDAGAVKFSPRAAFFIPPALPSTGRALQAGTMWSLSELADTSVGGVRFVGVRWRRLFCFERILRPRLNRIKPGP